MDKELHEKALEAAIAEAVAAPGVSMFRSSNDRDKWIMERAIAEYLRVAGLTVVPVEPTEDQITARNWRDGIVKQYKSMLAAFPSPFDEATS